MVKDKQKMWRDILILILISVAIYYYRVQSGDVEVYNPVSGFQAFWEIGG